MNVERLIADRSRAIDASGIRRVFDLGAKLKDPINLSIGQPDFPVPDAVKRAACAAILEDRNGYTVTQGVPALRERLALHIADDLGWDVAVGGGGGGDRPGLIVTTGTSGALWLGALAIANPGDEIIISDPYFVLYPHLCSAVGAKAVMCDIYPDFRMTAERVEPLITARTKAILVNSPSNPGGVVLTDRECRDLLDLCRARGVLLISDEIYDEFTYSESRGPAGAGWDGGGGGGTVGQGGMRGRKGMRCPSPARFAGAEEDVLVIRGFGKTYGCTGWRLGYATGPRRLIEEMTKLQQYTFVCAPSALQWGVAAALDVDMSGPIHEYQKRRDLAVQRLEEVTEVAKPGGAFYVFPRVPSHLGLTGTKFVDRCLERNLLAIPGGVFSAKDTHIRISFATPMERLQKGLDVLCDLMRA